MSSIDHMEDQDYQQKLDFESLGVAEKKRVILAFLRENAIPNGTILVHGSLALELMGFDLASVGSKDIDLVCLYDGMFERLALKHNIDPENKERIGINWHGVSIEIFDVWAPAKGLEGRNKEALRDRSWSYVFEESIDEYSIQIPNILDIIVYKNTRSAKSTGDPVLNAKIERDLKHLHIIFQYQWELFQALFIRSQKLVGRNTEKIAVKKIIQAIDQMDGEDKESLELQRQNSYYKERDEM